ncbi:hypothetical protein ABIA35_004456 [Catenulispora sp. MAP12-49]|uniref:hypothetical protein n=1 Tax=unclassified Catenulispora TaxID=414885 RepID=UPI0035120823
MATALEKIAVREQVIATAADDLRAQIQNLTDRLRDLDAEAADLATARKFILALGEDEPPATHPGLPDNPLYQHILTALAGADTPRRARDLCRDLDLGTEPTNIESLRYKLKRLVSTGLIDEEEPGLFAVPRSRTPDTTADQHS